jgi:hypothetical protein
MRVIRLSGISTVAFPCPSNTQEDAEEDHEGVPEEGGWLTRKGRMPEGVQLDIISK